MEQSTVNFVNVANVPVDSDSITLQKEKNGVEEHYQEDLNIIYSKNEANNSMNAIKTVDASKRIEQNASKSIQAGTAKYFLN